MTQSTISDEELSQLILKANESDNPDDFKPVIQKLQDQGTPDAISQAEVVGAS